MKPQDVSIVIPTLNEAGTIGSCVQSALAAGAQEVIVSDGGSNDETERRAAESGATKVIRSLPGRGIQLNAGATFAKGDIVLFLHADNRLGEACLRQICEADQAGEPIVWGAFRQRIDAPGWVYRMLEFGNALRVTVRRIPFGDQAMFVRRQTYKQEGGFAEVPLMEDVDFSKRFREIAKPTLLHGPVTVSSRRWETSGVLRQTFRNWRIQVAYALGVSPERLQDWYR
ncbi:MAG: glycosyltransferase family 2 protein [Pirellulaceae bacterium]|nr:glycosyltransferase family 2 protein [Pirellulaceae bacterium]